MRSIQLPVICPWLARKKCIKCERNYLKAWTSVNKSNKFKKIKGQKKEEADTIAKKQLWERGEYSLSIKNDEYNDSEISGTNLD